MSMTITVRQLRRGGREKIGISMTSWRKATAGIGGVVVTLLEWRERARQRRQLLSLSDSVLKDLGRTRCDAFGEARKPFWQA